jgi:hypothetical protein
MVEVGIAVVAVDGERCATWELVAEAGFAKSSGKQQAELGERR